MKKLPHFKEWLAKKYLETAITMQPTDTNLSGNGREMAPQMQKVANKMITQGGVGNQIGNIERAPTQTQARTTFMKAAQQGFQKANVNTQKRYSFDDVAQATAKSMGMGNLFK